MTVHLVAPSDTVNTATRHWRPTFFFGKISITAVAVLAESFKRQQALNLAWARKCVGAKRELSFHDIYPRLIKGVLTCLDKKDS